MCTSPPVGAFGTSLLSSCFPDADRTFFGAAYWSRTAVRMDCEGTSAASPEVAYRTPVNKGKCAETRQQSLLKRAACQGARRPSTAFRMRATDCKASEP